MGLKNSSFSLKMKRKKRLNNHTQQTMTKDFHLKMCNIPAVKLIFFCILTPQKVTLFILTYNFITHSTSILLFFPLAKYYSFFKLISFLLPFSPPLPQNPISDKIIFFLCLPCYGELLVLAVHYNRMEKKKLSLAPPILGTNWNLRYLPRQMVILFTKAELT